MQFPMSWLRTFCNPDLTDVQIAEMLTMGGLEVEEMQAVAPPFSQVVVAEIKEVEKHPDADRLRVCQVDVGQGALLQIVCGAPNARVGIKVPCAQVGAELPAAANSEDAKPFSIKLGKLRGVESQGMLCSAKELHISTEGEGLLELPLEAPVGQNIRDYLQLDDAVLTLKLTPNLAHCLSVYGVARELSALSAAPLAALPLQAIEVKAQDKLKVKIEATDLCGRFSGRIVKGVNISAKTPQWMVDRLTRCGQRSVSALVDISNYVMFESGQPTHIFDLDKITGDLQVRWGKAGETLKLLNGNTITVDEKVGVIADASGLKSLAGIMGGDACAVSDSTQNIYIEAAFWWADAVAGRSRRYQFTTEAGHRFERGVDPSHTLDVIDRITQLVLDICGGTASDLDDQAPHLPATRTLAMRVSRASKVIGMPLTLSQCQATLERLGLIINAEGLDTVQVKVPAHRFDLNLEEDLIEEVARLIGYQNLPTTDPIAPIRPQVLSENQKNRYALRHQLAELGYSETINFSFVDEAWERELYGNTDAIRLLNPIASQMNVMRSNLLGSLLQVLKYNLDRKADQLRVFEIGRVFVRDASVVTSDTCVKGIDQPMRVAGLAYGDPSSLRWDAKEKAVDYYDVKGDIEALLAPRVASFHAIQHPALHPGRSAEIRLDGKVIGLLGELHPKHRQTWDLPQAPLFFELDLTELLVRKLPSFTAVSKFQPVERDIAILLDEKINYADVQTDLAPFLANGTVEKLALFDIYRPPAEKDAGKKTLKSMGIRVTMSTKNGTPSESETESVVKMITEQLSTTFGASLR